MSASAAQTHAFTFKLGWWILLAISALGVVGQTTLAVALSENAAGFIPWAALFLYSVAVVLIPYWRLERWAWYLTWVLVVPLAVLALSEPEAAPYFLSAAGLLALGQLLTRPAFYAPAP